MTDNERLMLGYKGGASLLVEVRKRFSETDFIFHVINGNWTGRYMGGRMFIDRYIDVHDPNPETYRTYVEEGGVEYQDGYCILTSDQELLKYLNVGDNYNDVFNNFIRSKKNGVK